MSIPPVGVGGLELGLREKRYLHDVIESSRLSYGPYSRRFEEEFARIHDSRFALFCSSGTAALHLAVAALKERYGWKDGDEVLVPALTFISTSNIVLHNGLRPVFVEVDPKTYNIDPADLERRVTRRTRAVIPVHLMGLPCDMDPVMALARKRGLRVVEDSCETMFARYKGRVVGSFGDVGCFSTYVAHFIVAGIGGLATTSDPKLAVLMRSLMNHGRDNIYISIDDDNQATGRRLEIIAAKRFSFVHLGHNFRVTELEAAIGLAQLEDREAIIARRRRIAEDYLKGLADLEDHIQLPVTPPDRDHVFMLFPIVVRKGSKRPLINFLEHRGVETRDLMPLLSQPVYRRLFPGMEKRFPVAGGLSRSGFYIGCHQYITDEQKNYVIESFHEFFKGKGTRGARRGSGVPVQL